MSTTTCTRCIYNSSIPYITFDNEGVCNYCRQHDELNKMYPTGDEGMQYLTNLAAKIKREQKNKPYDVVVGVSGGTDSSYMLWFTKEILGLRPLAAHYDNTWNSDIAVENIQKVTAKLGIDLYTHVVDNREYADVFKSFLKASVPDVDTPSDIALATVHYMACRKYGIRYIFEGHSFRTEGISPHGWFYMDARYIRSVQKQFGQQKIKTLPLLDMHKWLKWTIFDGIKKIRPLYYLDYDKEKTKQFLYAEFGWKYYGGHHMENRTAWFTNNFWLPRKFGYDLRLCEFSALVRSGQWSRQEALLAITKPKPIEQELLTEVKKRLGLSEEVFQAYLLAPNKSYRDYPTYKKTFERLRWFFYLLAKANLIPLSFYLKYTRNYDKEQNPG
jgi:N-acetyl sugar amidotransferase